MGPWVPGRLMDCVAVAAISLWLVAAGLGPGRVWAAELSAPEIVARNVAARGGLEAWRKVETMVWTGHIESAHAPAATMQFKLEMKRPNKTRLQINALGQKSLRVFDGVHGWKARPAARAEQEPYTPQELKSAKAGHGIDGPLIDYAAKGNSVTLESVDEIAGRKTYHLNVHLAKGGNEHVWVDADTYLDVRYDRIAEGPSGTPRRVSTTYDDYRTVEGLQIPFLITTGGGQGTTPDKMQIETVVLNVPLDDSVFGNQAASHSRNRMRPAVPQQAPEPAPSARTAAHEGTGTASR